MATGCAAEIAPLWLRSGCLQRRPARRLAGRLARVVAVVAAISMVCSVARSGDDTLLLWRDRFVQEVDRHLDVPLDDQQRYIDLLQQAWSKARLPEPVQESVVLVDRNSRVQAAFVLVSTDDHRWFWLGGSPVSTGRKGSFDHFTTPLGVFAHGLANPDFRAEGTYNSKHIRGYGVRGMRVFDFGWTVAERGWGGGGQSIMRLQMHATDPTRLEPRLGRADSKGCIRIAATFNDFLDRYGVLDADYEQWLASGETAWVLRADRTPLPWPGRYLVVVDSGVVARPPWTALPAVGPAPSQMR